MTLWCLAYLHGQITMFIGWWDWSDQYLLLFLTQPSSGTQKTFMKPGGRHRVNTCKCGREKCKVSGTDWATVLAKDPFLISYLERDWSLWLALLSLKYLDALLCCKKRFYVPCCPKKQRRYHSVYLHWFILLRLNSVINDLGTDCASSHVQGHQEAWLSIYSIAMLAFL